MAQDMNTGLVAVSDRSGGFHVYMTGGLWEPARWLAGRLDGAGWFASLDDLRWSAERQGRQLRRHADYYQLPPAPMDARATWEA